MNYFILAGLYSQQYDWKGIIQYVLFSCFKSVLSFLCCFHFLWGNRQFSHLIMKLLAQSSHLESRLFLFIQTDPDGLVSKVCRRTLL